ncbi:MAG: DUF4446 family protein [Patescibacteria group bacterium]|nr:DUF4446 family protein [Patescibacteria group bacterium]
MALASLHLQTLLASAKIYLAIAAPYTAAGALVLALASFLYMLALRRRLARLLMGRTGSLEETIAVLAREMQEMKAFRGELEKYLKLVETRLRGGLSGLGVVRFNPFAGTGQGGNQSFAAALLDEEGHGVVLSTLYARDRVGVYAKPIEHGSSSYELTGEEKEAIQKAQGAVAARKPKK